MSARPDRAPLLGSTLSALLQGRTQQEPFHKVYTWLEDGDRVSASFSHSELDQRARAIAAHLESLKLRRKRAVLLYSPGLHFIEALFGCFYAGIIAVPAYVPGSSRESPRIEGILQDSDAGITLTSSYNLESVSQLVERGGPDCSCFATDTIPTELGDGWTGPPVKDSDIAYLQYTSGSTSAPKGVMLTHANVMANLSSIAAHGGFNNSSVSVTWLPLIHKPDRTISG